MLRITCLLLLVNALVAVRALDLEGRILWNDVCHGIDQLGQSKVILDSGRLSGSIRRDGSFSIPDIEAGSYILSVLAHDITFDNLRIDVLASDSLPEVRPYVQGTPHSPPSPISLPYPITLVPRQKSVYFVERESFNLLGMLSNPMILMMVGTGVVVMGMPYLMKNLDPKLAEDVQLRQARMSNLQSSLQSGDLRGGLSALLSGSEEGAGSVASAPAEKKATSSKNRGGAASKGRRR